MGIAVATRGEYPCQQRREDFLCLPCEEVRAKLAGFSVWLLMPNDFATIKSGEGVGQ
jgi:hypothetical protein